MFEVETKVRVGKPDQLKEHLKTHAEFIRTYRKSDRYYRHDLLEKTVRLREDGNWLVTYKDKKLENGIEINGEYEFAVSSPEDFTQMLFGLGFREDIRKTKEGVQYRLDGLLLELSRVEKLGWFLEIEKVVRDKHHTEEAAATIRRMITRLGFREKDIEPRYYSEILRSIKENNEGDRSADEEFPEPDDNAPEPPRAIDRRTFPGNGIEQ